MRRYYLDNIRWAAVLLVVVYHVFYLFNAAGVPGSIGTFSNVQYQDSLLYAVYPWFMVLLFVIAGMSARYALEAKTVREFVKSRTVKLLVPSTLGVLLFQWIVGWMNAWVSGGFQYLNGVPVPVLYIIFVASGIGPLWFAQTLWLYSLLLVLIRKLDKNDKFYSLCGKMHPAFLLLFGFLLWGGAQFGNVPVIKVYRFGIYGVAFFAGYFVLSHDKMQEWLAKYCLPLLLVAANVGAAYVLYYFRQDYTSDECLRGLFTNLYAGLAVLMILGCGKACADRKTPFTEYMSRTSFGIFVLHYLFVLSACIVLKRYTPLPALMVYILAIVTALAASIGCYELFRKIPVVRWVVLGENTKRQG